MAKITTGEANKPSNGTGPVIKFREIRYGDHLDQMELWAKIEAGEKTATDEIIWTMSLVIEWDLKDVDTGEPIIVGDYRRLTLVQRAAFFAAWDAHAAQTGEAVKKTRKPG